MELIEELELTQMADQVERACAVVLRRYAGDPARAGGGGGGNGPAPLTEALYTLFQVLLRFESDCQSGRHSLSGDDLSELGEQGQMLLDDLVQWGLRLGVKEVRASVEELVVPWSLWLAGRGARLRHLEPLVNQLAALANRSSEPGPLRELDAVYSTVIAAVDPSVSQDLDKGNPQRPWRVLVLNRSIVATRTLDPDAMSAAFEALIHYLPEEASDFFSDGMHQMDQVGYPDPVREVMQRYHRLWTASTLH